MLGLGAGKIGFRFQDFEALGLLVEVKNGWKRGNR